MKGYIVPSNLEVRKNHIIFLFRSGNHDRGLAGGASFNHPSQTEPNSINQAGGGKGTGTDRVDVVHNTG